MDLSMIYMIYVIYLYPHFSWLEIEATNQSANPCQQVCVRKVWQSLAVATIVFLVTNEIGLPV